MAAASIAGFAACGDDDDDIDVVEDDSPTSPDGDAWSFGTIDSNGDSYLDNDEVAEWIDRDGVFETWDEDADSELDADEVSGNAFEHWDADGNGMISSEEWETSARAWYPGGAHVEVFQDFDGDGDSEIDADEFAERFDISILGEEWTAPTIDEDMFATSYFKLYDSDDDGKVSEDEFAAGASTWGTPEEG